MNPSLLNLGQCVHALYDRTFLYGKSSNIVAGFFVTEIQYMIFALCPALMGYCGSLQIFEFRPIFPVDRGTGISRHVPDCYVGYRVCHADNPDFFACQTIFARLTRTISLAFDN